MPRLPFHAIALSMILTALLPAQQTIKVINPPMAGNGGPGGWKVDPGRGDLSFSIPIGTIPGELPIPVAFSMNGTFMSNCVWVLFLPRGMFSLWRDFGVHGTLGFGHIGWGRQNGVPENKMVVLEDGRTYAETDFTASSGGASDTSLFGVDLLPAYGIDGLSTPMRISSDGSLAWAKIPTADFRAKFSPLLGSHLPAGYGATTSYDLVMDKERIRVFAEVEAICPPYLSALHPARQNPNAPIGLPIYWADRFGHFVTFQWTKSTSCLPAGISSLVRVDALNQRNQGVTVRYADWNDNTSPQDLLRADFVGCEGPSVFMHGYSGTAVKQPVGYSNLYLQNAFLKDFPLPIYLGGMVARPTTILLGDPNTLEEPSWNNSGSFPATPPALPATNSGCATRAWALGYDANLAALTSITSPALVQTRFSEHKRYTLVEGPGGTYPALLWGVTRAEEADTSGRSAYTHTVTWDRTIPHPIGKAWPHPNWIVTSQDWWNHGGSTPSDRTATYTFASPAASLLDYRNMFLESYRLTDGASSMATSTVSTTRNNRGGGLDGNLTLPQTITTVRSGENGRQVDYAYTDGTGLQVESITDLASYEGTYFPIQVRRFTYNNQSRLLESHQVKQVRTTRYRMGVECQPMATTTNVWDPANPLQLSKTFKVADAWQHGQTFTYDGEGRLAEQGVHHVEGNIVLASPTTVTIAYDPGTGQPATWTTSYLEVPTGTGSIVRSAGDFDGGNRPTLLTDENRVQTRLAYDLYGRVTYSATQGTLPTVTGYPDPWTVVKTQGAMTTTTHLDGFGRRIGEDLPDGIRLAYSYGPHGLLESAAKTSPAGHVLRCSTSYDLLDRPTFRKDFDGTTIAFTYAAARDALDRVTRTQGGAQPSSTLTDPFGQVVEARAPNGDVTTNRYDGLGHLVGSRIDPGAGGNAQTRVFSYDGLERMLWASEPETGVRLFSAFNALNLPTTITEAATRTRTLAHDGLGRLRSRSANVGGVTATESFTYAGSLLTDASSTVTGAEPVSQHFEYDPPEQGGRLRVETTAQAGLTTSVGYAYTGLGAVGSISYPDGRIVTYGFDGLGRPTSVASSLNGSSQDIIPAPPAAPFDEWGNRSATVFHSGAKDQWSVDATGARPGSALIVPKTGNPLGWTYQYDQDTGWLTGTGEWSLQNDSLGRLTRAAQNWSLAQDAQGATVTQAANLLTITLEHDAYGNNTRASGITAGTPPPALNDFNYMALPTNRLPIATAAPANGVINAAYAPTGELLSVATGVSSNQVLSMAWTPLERLAAANHSRTGATAAYRYTASGLRVNRTESKDPALNRFYVYTSNGRLLSEYSNGGVWGRDVVYLDDRVIAEIDGNGVHELHSDHLRTPRIITSAETGAMEGTQTYGSYGELIGAWGYQPLTGYTGHLQTEPNGMIYMKGRFYSPAWHCFLNSNQGADKNQINQYAYCSGNPFRGSDPSGMDVGFLPDWATAARNPGWGIAGGSSTVTIGNFLYQRGIGASLGWGGWTQMSLESLFGYAYSMFRNGGNRHAGVDAKQFGENLNRSSSTTDSWRSNNNGLLFPVLMWNDTNDLIPHTFLQTPNMTRGYYPVKDWHFAAMFVTSPGEIRDDSNHQHDSLPARTFLVDAATLEKVEQGMKWNPGFYELNNGIWNHAFNCTGWANRVLAAAGLDANWSGIGANPWIN